MAPRARCQTLQLYPNRTPNKPMSALIAETVGSSLTCIAADRQLGKLREKLKRKNAALLDSQQEAMLLRASLEVYHSATRPAQCC